MKVYQIGHSQNTFLGVDTVEIARYIATTNLGIMTCGT